MITVGINGLGRVGRALLRILTDCPGICIAAINDRVDIENLAYLIRNDSVYGAFGHEVRIDNGGLSIRGRHIAVHSHDEISAVPWGCCQVIVDSSGDSRNVVLAHRLVGSGVKKVIVTHAQGDVDTTIVAPSINCGKVYDPQLHHVISASICDAIAIAPVLCKIEKACTIRRGFITTLHPWLNYQNLSDGDTAGFFWQVDYQLGRASTMNVIPKQTTLISALAEILPGIAAQLSAMSFRVPVPVVCAAEMHLRVAEPISLAVFREMWREAAALSPDVFGYNEAPLASIDFKGTPANCVVDGRWLVTSGDALRVILWYDNEWGYASHVARLIQFIGGMRET